MQTIRAYMKDGFLKEWTDKEDIKYEWQIGMAGELIIYYRKVHKVISNAEIDGGILCVYNATQWCSVDVLQE